jgi:hypothetical protein
MFKVRVGGRVASSLPLFLDAVAETSLSVGTRPVCVTAAAFLQYTGRDRWYIVDLLYFDDRWRRRGSLRWTRRPRRSRVSIVSNISIYSVAINSRFLSLIAIDTLDRSALRIVSNVFPLLLR